MLATRYADCRFSHQTQMANEQNDKLILAMGLIAKQAGSGKPFSLPDFCRDLDTTVPQFFIEQRMFTFSAQRYEIEVDSGGRGRDQREKYYLPDVLRSLLTEYKATNGTTKKRRFNCISDNRRTKPVKKKRVFLLAQTNFDGSFKREGRWAWGKATELLKPYGFEPATAMELLSFYLPNNRVFTPQDGGPVRICSVDAIEILKGNHTEKTGFLHKKHQSHSSQIGEVLEEEPCLDGKNDFLLIKEIEKK